MRYFGSKLNSEWAVQVKYLKFISRIHDKNTMLVLVMEGPSNCCEEYPLVPHRPPQFNTSFPHKNHTLSALKMPQFHTSNPLLPPLRQFHTKNPSVHHKTPSVQHKTPSVPHQNPSVQQIPQTNTVFLVWN